MKSFSYRNRSIFVALMALALLSACKKNKTPAPEPEPEETDINTKQTPTTNRTELTNDSLFLYARQIYYWNTSLPTYDTYLPRQYSTLSTPLDNYENNLFNLVKTSKSEDYVAARSSTKYSFIEDITTRNPDVQSAAPNAKASVDLEGNGNDIGIYGVDPSSNPANNGATYRLCIQAVSKGSPADLAGLSRGFTITKINQSSIGRISGGQVHPDEVDVINATIYGEPATLHLEGLKADGKTPYSVELVSASYKSSPIYKNSVITAGSKKIGYLAYARFSNSENSVSALNAVFSDFASKSVTDLVIDLRYNGGGYVNTAEHLINLIVPSSVTGVMYVEYFNEMMRNNKATILKNQLLLDENDKIQYVNGRMRNYYEDQDYSVAANTYSFSKKGNLNGVQNVVFLVSGGTASASELVINSLKAKMTVKIVGEKTYGKPIGFFPIRLENRYDVYLSLFETKNSLGEGGYYSGMTPDYVLTDKDLSAFDFGNPEEPYLKQALAYLAPGITNFSSTARISSAPSASRVSTNARPIGSFGNEKEFKGMIEDRRSPRK